jgi:hypothetical protein
MADESEPPRTEYRFKEADFERLNSLPTDAESPRMDGVVVPADAAPRNVDEILRQNVEAGKAAGHFHVEPGEDKARKRRIKLYWLSVAAINIPLGAIAWFSGHTDPFPFVFSLGGMAFFTGRLTWETWFLNTER